MLIHTEEQCLFLNVFTPEEAVNKSVMVWIHGGTLTSGIIQVLMILFQAFRFLLLDGIVFQFWL